MSDIDKKLWKAIQNDSYSNAKKALEQGANPNFAKPQGLSVLMYAVWIGRDSIVRLLCEKGANVNYQHPVTGDTALMMAVAGAQIETVRTLCEYGANKALQDAKGNRAEDFVEESNAFSQIEQILESCGVTDPAALAPAAPAAPPSFNADPTAVQPANNTDPQGGKRRKTRRRRRQSKRKAKRYH